MLDNILIIHNADFELITAIQIDRSKFTVRDAIRIARGEFWYIPFTIGSWSAEKALTNVDRILEFRASLQPRIGCWQH